MIRSQRYTLTRALVGQSNALALDLLENPEVVTVLARPANFLPGRGRQQSKAVPQILLEFREVHAAFA
jgi:hypothetical protein